MTQQLRDLPRIVLLHPASQEFTKVVLQSSLLHTLFKFRPLSDKEPADVSLDPKHIEEILEEAIKEGRDNQSNTNGHGSRQIVSAAQQVNKLKETVHNFGDPNPK
jgi:hypothetical protein